MVNDPRIPNLRLPAALVSSAVTVVFSAVTPASATPAELETFFSSYCYTCHDSDVQKAELNLEALLRGGEPSIDDAAQWETVLHMIGDGEMPPKEKAQPSQAERDVAAGNVKEMLQRWADSLGENPGRVTVRRLNRQEYNNTIRHLVGVDFEPAANFPRDEVGYGFDNIGDVLSLSPVLMEKYLDAAEEIADAAILKEIPEWPPVFAPKQKALELLSWEEDRFVLPLQGTWTFTFSADGAEPFASTLAFDSDSVSDLEVRGKRATLTATNGDQKWNLQVEEAGAGQLVGVFDSGGQRGVVRAKALAGPALAGEWDGVAVLPDGRDLRQRLVLITEGDGSLSGRMEYRDEKRRVDLDEIKADGHSLEVHFTVEIDSRPTEVVLKLDHNGDKLKGRWQIAAASAIAGDWSATRQEKRPELDNVRPEGRRGVGLHREGEARFTCEIGETGRYKLAFEARQQRGGPEDALLGLFIDGEEVEQIAIAWEKPRRVEREFELEEGTHRIALAYLNNYVNQQANDPRLRGDRNLFARSIELVGPLGIPRPALPESHVRLVPVQPAKGTELKVARQALSEFASRAFRRPASDAEIGRLTKLVEFALDDGGTYGEGMQLALQAVLVSPHFLFRWELDAERAAPKGIRQLDAYELASRLSYFLWSSMPDDELFALAMDRSLLDENVLRQQARRMLADPKSDAFVRNFAGQWLQIRNLESIKPDAKLFPEFDDSLRHSMAEETYLFFNAVLRENLSVATLLDADFTYLNGQLATHYGFETNVELKDPSAFEKVVLPADSRRGGVLGHAGILTITSSPTRTSPVNRGKWVLEQLLGTPPPPPPPDVPELEESREAVQAASLRERMRHHRENPDCAGCHAKMDPIGFALENFDGIGRWRDFDGNFPINPAGTLADGSNVSGPDSLKEHLRNHPEFTNSLIKKILTYAIGRGVEFTDSKSVAAIRDKTAQNGFKLADIMEEIVCSAPFLKRSIEVADASQP